MNTLKHLRKRFGISITEFAQNTGVEAARIIAAESGRIALTNKEYKLLGGYLAQHMRSFGCFPKIEGDNE